MAALKGCCSPPLASDSLMHEPATHARSLTLRAALTTMSLAVTASAASRAARRSTPATMEASTLATSRRTAALTGGSRGSKLPPGRRSLHVGKQAGRVGAQPPGTHDGWSGG